MSAADGCFRAGIWVRDSTAGIGILTFVDERNGVFGAVRKAAGYLLQFFFGELMELLIQHPY